MARDGGAILAEDLTDSSADKDNVLRGSAAAMLSKKLLVNSTSLLYEQVGKEKNLSRAVSDYMSLALYKVYRLLYAMDDGSSKKAFAAPQSVFSELCDAEMKKCEALLRLLAEKGENQTIDMSLEHVQQNWPRLAPSLLSLLHGVDEKISPEIEKN